MEDKAEDMDDEDSQTAGNLCLQCRHVKILSQPYIQPAGYHDQ